MTLNVSALTTRVSLLSRGRRWNALESPEPGPRRRIGLLFKFVISNWTSERNWLWQGACSSSALCTFIFLLTIWTLLMLGSDVSILIFTLRYCNTGTIVQLCWTQYYENESSCPGDHILSKRNQYHQATRSAINRNYISSFDSAELNIWFSLWFNSGVTSEEVIPDHEYWISFMVQYQKGKEYVEKYSPALQFIFSIVTKKGSFIKSKSSP